MNKRLLIFTLFITCVYTTSLFAQDRLGVYAAAFYNLENLWDTVDGPNNEGDDDFTPEGKYEWTQTKYEQKLQNIDKVISQLGRDYRQAGHLGSGKPESIGRPDKNSSHQWNGI